MFLLAYQPLNLSGQWFSRAPSPNIDNEKCSSHLDKCEYIYIQSVFLMPTSPSYWISKIAFPPATSFITFSACFRRSVRGTVLCNKERKRAMRDGL